MYCLHLNQSKQMSGCKGKTKERQKGKYDLDKMLLARFIVQVWIHIMLPEMK